MAMEETRYIRRITNRLTWLIGGNIVLAFIVGLLSLGVVQSEWSIAEPRITAVFWAYAIGSLAIIYGVHRLERWGWKTAFAWTFSYLWFIAWLLTFSDGALEGPLLFAFLVAVFMACGVVGYVQDKKSEVYYRGESNESSTLTTLTNAVGAVIIGILGIAFGIIVFNARLGTFVELTISGIGLGSLYALIAVGFVVIFKITDVLNFAHGMLVVFVSYLVVFFTGLGVPPIIAVFLVIVVVSIALAILLERLIFKHFIGEPVLSVIMVTLGLFFILDSLPRILTGGAVTRAYSGSLNPDFSVPLFFGSANIVTVIAIVSSVVLVLALLGFFKYYVVGSALRAAASDEHGAVVLGISTEDTVKLGWGLGIMLTVIGAILLSMHRGGASYELQYTLFLVFPAVVFGGLDSIKGALVGAIVIGLLQTFGSFYYTRVIGPGIGEVLPLIFLLVVIIIKPYGIWGTERIERI